MLMKLDGMACLGLQEAIPLSVFSFEPVGAVGAMRGSAIGEWRTVRVDVEWPGGISRPCDCVIHSCIDQVDILLGEGDVRVVYGRVGARDVVDLLGPSSVCGGEKIGNFGSR